VRGGAFDTNGGEVQTRQGLRGEHHGEEGQPLGKERRLEAHRNGGLMVRAESGRSSSG
jgi:hypothetical protein